MRKLLRQSIRAVPWRIRSAIKDIPLVAPFQRRLLKRYLEEDEFIHRVDAGPARGLRYPVKLPDDKGIWTGTYERELSSRLAREVRPGSTCLDIGGWRGFHAGVMALSGASRVFVFEPLPMNCSRIRRLIELNPGLPIELIEAAVSDEEGSAEFRTMTDSSMGKLSASSFRPRDEATGTIKVRVLKLDDLFAHGLIGSPSVIKIDVEGAELLVLRGAKELLERCQPTLFLEVHSQVLAEDCRDFLTGIGYRMSLVEETLAPPSREPEVQHFVASKTAASATVGRFGRSDWIEREGTGGSGSIDIPILLYHNLIAGNESGTGNYEISIRQFEEQLDQLLKWGFEIINFAALLRILEGLEPPRPRMAIITFDDGFVSFAELGLPALQKRGIGATLFVPVGELGGKNSWDSNSGIPERSVVSETQLREIAAGGTEIGSHGWLHRSLPDCSLDQATQEIVDSRQRLVELGFSADVFAYPYGHHSPKYCAMAKDAGYRAATTIFSNASTVTANRFAMRRIYIHPADTSLRFWCKLSRPYLRYKAFRGIPIHRHRSECEATACG